MRSVTALVLAAATVVLAGCTPMAWVKADVTPEEAERDAIDCQQAAWREARWRAWNYRPFGVVPFHDPFGRRFLAWPYSPWGPWGDPFSDPYLEEGRLAQFCMRNKGYELEYVEKPAGR